MKEPKNDPHHMENPKKCDVAMDPEDEPLFYFGEDSGATENDWWE